jgi:hypothetical protein
MNKALLLFASIIFAVSPASAGCFLCFFTLDREGTGRAFCDEHKSAEIVSLDVSEPRYSIYNFLVVSTFSGSNCPPEKKVPYRGVWDRVTRKAEETGGDPVETRTTTCTRNPWTTAGVIHRSGYYDVACNSFLPVTSSLLSPETKNRLRTKLEPLYTRCKVTSPVGFAATKAKQNTSLPVVVAHNEYQEISWTMTLQKPGGEKKIIEPAPQPFPPLLTTSGVNNKQIAETTRYFWLSEPGLYWIEPAARLKGESPLEAMLASLESVAAAAPAQPLACFPAAFIKVGEF